MEWNVEATVIAQCHYRNLLPTKKCGVKESLEARGIKVLNYSGSDGALSISLSSPNDTARPNVYFLCTVRGSFDVDRHNVTVDFSVECKLRQLFKTGDKLT